MPMLPADMAADMVNWIGPTQAGDTPDSQPPVGGYPGIDVSSPDPPEAAEPLQGTSPGASSGANTLAVVGITPTDFVNGGENGYCVAAPYWEGAKILVATPGEITLETGAAGADAFNTVRIVATSAGQLVWNLPGSPNAFMLSVVRDPILPDLVGTTGAIDDTNPSHDPRSGVVAISAMDPAVQVGETLEFVYQALLTVTAGADEQDTYTLPGTPNVSEVQAVVTYRNGTKLYETAADTDNPSHDPSNGIISIYVPADGGDDPDLLEDDVVEFQFKTAHTGPVPAGVDYILIPIPPPLTGDEDIRITTGQAWSGAYKALVAGGASNGVPIGDLTAATAAMEAVIDGMMVTAPFPGLPPMGALALTAGAAAFWGVVATQGAALFPGSIGVVIPPPAFATVSLAVMGAGAATLALSADDAPNTALTSADIMAAAVYATVQGGMVLFQPGPAPVPFPIL